MNQGGELFMRNVFQIANEYEIPVGIYLLKVNNRNTRTRC